MRVLLTSTVTVAAAALLALAITGAPRSLDLALAGSLFGLVAAVTALGADRRRSVLRTLTILIGTSVLLAVLAQLAYLIGAALLRNGPPVTP